MAYTNLTSLFGAIADAIRAKTGSNGLIKADDFPTEIGNIQTGGGTPEQGFVLDTSTQKGAWYGTSIPGYAFRCVLEGAWTSIYAYMFVDLHELECNSVESIGTYAFAQMSKLKTIHMPNVQTIGEYCFRKCSALVITDIPESVKRIENYAFASCTSIRTLVFHGTPEYLSTSPFSACANITDIYVPWSEGTVNNAPWGANNATIHYNWTPS